MEKANNFQLQKDEGDEYTNVSSSHEMDIQAEVWSKNFIEESLAKLTCKERDYLQDY